MSGLPFALSGIGILISINVGTLLLSLWRPAEEVGWYAVAFNLATALLLLWTAFGAALIPSLSRESVTNRAIVGQVFERAVMLILGLYLPVSVGLMIVADGLVHVLYTSEFAASVGALQVLAWLLPVRTLALFCGAIAWVLGKERSMARIYLVSALLETVVNVALIPPFGIYGAAAAAVFASVLALVQFLILLRQDVPLVPSKARLIGIITASAVMAAVALGLTGLVHWHLAAVVVGSAASYVVMLFVLQVVTIGNARQAVSLAFSSILRFQGP